MGMVFPELLTVSEHERPRQRGLRTPASSSAKWRFALWDDIGKVEGLNVGALRDWDSLVRSLAETR